MQNLTIFCFDFKPEKFLEIFKDNQPYKLTNKKDIAKWFDNSSKNPLNFVVKNDNDLLECSIIDVKRMRQIAFSTLSKIQCFNSVIGNVTREKFDSGYYFVVSTQTQEMSENIKTYIQSCFPNDFKIKCSILANNLILKNQKLLQTN